jgi:hypothetical protein
LQQRIAIFATFLAFGLTDLGVAKAQPGYGSPRVYDSHAYGPGGRIYDGSLLPFEVMRIVRSHGLAPLSRPARHGDYYEVIASTRSGGQMRVVIDAFAGDILKINPVVAGGPNGPRPAAPYDPSLPPRPMGPYDQGQRVPSPYDGPPEPSLGLPPQTRFDDGVPPVPPRIVPGARIANAPPPDAAAVPPPQAPVARTPIPRPRPAIAAREVPIEPPSLAGAPPAPAPVVLPAAVVKPVAAPKPASASNPASAPKPLPTGEAQMVPVAPLE